MNIYVVAGGPDQMMPPLNFNVNSNDVIVGVDRGVLRLLLAGYTPNEAFGDFDSITDEERAYIDKKLDHMNVFPSEKDETDLDLALSWCVKQKPNAIYVYGATGGRIDHLFGNTMLLLKGIEAGVHIEMIDKQNRLSLYKPGKYNITADTSFKYISFIPFSETVKSLTLVGFKYLLQQKTIHFGSTLCISNQLNKDCGTFSFASGILMMIRSCDLN
ncbi:thiamine diphosphokinase [Bacillus sp. HMF5848]|uniref:thiamine diphosphokinase n=1 Tax=Bacillus sp. HMF5848 TaxID=2495421 RepID=UPI000F7941FE|nr:thiamine diphosphokinase [Bacillus sp. HMF5848]RSK26984.1 thiamine diphosphokinase [Bacillus sp. HMF5848]